jgi:putative SOS response-associated peptidase YedK
LWERWTPEERAEPVDTFTILTTEPNDLHNRMPVILDPKDYGRWLDGDLPASTVGDLLKPYPAESMEVWPVSTRVNRPGNDGPELIERVEVG